jgi:dihydroorotate dehydrogenase
LIYQNVIRPALFRLFPDAEMAHDVGLESLVLLSSSCRRFPSLLSAFRRWAGCRPDEPPWGESGALSMPNLGRVVAGVRFPSPIGVAGGFDKRARAIHGWAALGFGFVEVGTVTRHPQPGNDRPRVFRLPHQQALINRFGFNNGGAEDLASTLRKLGPFPIPVMVSLGKSKVTPNEHAIEDYLFSLRTCHPVADLISINVSSPNTPGLRQLQDRAALTDLLQAILNEVRSLGAPPQPQWWVEGNGCPHHTPVFLKISPDLSDTALEELLTVASQCGVQGLIATNTTLDRSAIPVGTPHRDETGGLSGAPLHSRAVSVVATIRQSLPTMPIIGVGGIRCPETAQAMLQAGAQLIQIYTGLVYEGPSLVRSIHRQLLHEPGPRL